MSTHADSGDYTWPIGSETPAPLDAFVPAAPADPEDGCTAGPIDLGVSIVPLIRAQAAPPPIYDLSVFSEKIAAALEAIDRRLSKIEGYVDGSEIRVMYERGIGK